MANLPPCWAENQKDPVTDPSSMKDGRQEAALPWPGAHLKILKLGDFMQHVCSVISDTSWPHGPPGSSVHEILHQEYWSGLPFPPPGRYSWPRDRTRLLCLLHWQVDSLRPTLCKVTLRLSLPPQHLCKFLQISVTVSSSKSKILTNGPCTNELQKRRGVDTRKYSASNRGKLEDKCCSPGTSLGSLLHAAQKSLQNPIPGAHSRDAGFLTPTPSQVSHHHAALITDSAFRNWTETPMFHGELLDDKYM